MNEMAALARTKAEAMTAAVVCDSRWRLDDELMCQVFGFTMYGYVFGFSRNVCFMELEDIQRLALDRLTSLGIGAGYAEGLIQAASDEFAQEDNDSLQNQLIGIGFSHFGSDDLTELAESVFRNTDQIRESIG